MKAGWETKPLSAVCEHVKDDIVDGPFGSSLKREHYQPVGVPVLKIQNVKRFSLNDKRQDFVSEAKAAELQRHNFTSDDLVMTKLGDPLGATAKVPKGLSGIIVADLVRIRPKHADPDFLCYQMNSPQVSAWINKRSKGSTRPRVKISDVRDLPVVLPPLEEQQQIVAILDEAFEGLDRAKANAEANLASAEELFLSALRDLFDNRSTKWSNDAPPDKVDPPAALRGAKSRSATRTGGRDATLRPIPGKFSLSVLDPGLPTRQGWRWTALSALARMESGHTPSRRRPEYWGGEIPWIGIKDARACHGGTIEQTLEYTNPIGVDNSSTRLLPKGTVCLSRTASVGYVTVMGRPMATSQDFVNWVCSEALDPEFLMLLLLAQGDQILQFASGSVHQTIYFPEAKAFHICHPPISVQRRITSVLREVQEQASTVIQAKEAQALELEHLRQSLLAKAFAGELT